MNIFWIRYRSKWNSGNSEWEHKYFYSSERISCEEQISDFVTEESTKHDMMGAFRGIEVEMLDKVPENVLNNFIKAAEDGVKGAQSTLDNLKAYKASKF